jgi:hypothetical protein
MSVRHSHQGAPALGPGRTRMVFEGVVAMVGLAALITTLFGLALWVVVQLVLTVVS